ncbi:hypothetical protein BS47DRAFT_1398232 [Hydnum rufescens UP504]|uniref:Uncharacterized protein n=1 Tax=Hydnum rufescens UP504 TaxID=1448309 RepID=A0A9P6AL37_9AGAM|nr:hypothetical protein BS47DRAFT_1398232 [Hydnum rufescens UP504]
MPAKSLTPEVALPEAAGDGAATASVPDACNPSLISSQDHSHSSTLSTNTLPPSHKAKEFSAENDLEDKDCDADDDGADNEDSDSSDHNSKDEHVTFNHYSHVVSRSPIPAVWDSASPHLATNFLSKTKVPLLMWKTLLLLATDPKLPGTTGISSSGMPLLEASDPLTPPFVSQHSDSHVTHGMHIWSVRNAVIETLPNPAVSLLQDSGILLLQDSVIPLLRDSTVPSLQEAIVPSLRDSTALSLRDSAAPSLRDSTVPSLQRDSTAPSFKKSSIDTTKTLGAEESWYAQHLEHADLLVASKHWGTLLANWASLEEDLANSEENSLSRLTSKNHPIAIHDWVKRAQSLTWMPDLSDAKGLKAYGDKWHEWWAACQLTWRVKKPNSNEFLPSNGQGDWSILCIGGNNGLLLHVMALAWWGNASLHDVKETKWWTAAVKEVLWVLGHMLTSHRK